MTITRMCIACRQRKNKYELLRIVSNGDNPVLDKEYKINQRGMYICNDKKCIQKLINSKNLSKVLKINVNTEKLKELLKNLEE